MAQSLTLAATAVAAVGTLAAGAASAQQARYEGQAQQQVANFQAKQMQQRAGQERAVSQMQAVEERRKARLARSRAIAVAGASGGGTGGTVQDILSDLSAEGELNAQTALYEGEETARGLETQARATRAEGKYASAAGRYAAKNISRASYLSAAGTTMQGAASFYSKYWPTEEEVLDTGSVSMTKGGSKFGRYSSQIAYG
jgi:hypothetical protein